MKTETANAPAAKVAATEEAKRLASIAEGQEWRRWGPYVAERQWGTVREDYSENGDAWNYFPFEQAMSRAYRWGEDGIGGFSDDRQRLCIALALWNGADPFLKERLYGLTNGQGNHGEDVKELSYYLDGAPSHAYMKMLYKYPQAAFPYHELKDVNARRSLEEREYEIIDTGVFDDNRYFDVEIEYAKADIDDVLLRVSATNRGDQPAELALLPTVWFRNRWSWSPLSERPELRLEDNRIAVYQFDDVERELAWDFDGRALFCNNDTNYHKLFGQQSSGYSKDGINDFVVHGDAAAINPANRGTKAAVHCHLILAPGAAVSLRLRLRTRADSAPFADFDDIFAKRIEETDAFYGALQIGIADPDVRLVQRQAYAGMLWCKQFYGYDIRRWLAGDPLQPAPPDSRRRGRNSDWRHFASGDTDAGQAGDILSMPDSWEYPWFAAWDLAFHCIAFADIDPEFAKGQLVLLTREWYMHPNGQLPAYEWAFGDVNPPVHAWAAFRVFQIDRRQRRETNPDDAGDLMFLERVFQKLLLNFTWWVNRKDEQGRNIFQGGFLGLDNIGVFDRSKPLPTGGFMNQADGTSWMATYCLNLLRISLELAQHNHVYEDIASKFFEHFLSIAAAINGVGDDSLGLWDETDQFYYDHLNLPDGENLPVKIQSAVGLIPLLAVETLEPEILKQLPEFSARMEWYLQNRPQAAVLISNWRVCGEGDRHLLSLLRGHRMKALLSRMLDETQFLSERGVRSLSKIHERQPFYFTSGGTTYEVTYWPAESRSRVFGGNSNWRGPVWMPLNYLLIEALQKFHYYYGDDFKIECPTGSGKFLTILEVSCELAHRLAKLFLKGPDGQRAVLKYHPKLAGDPNFKDYVLFHEYFDGDSGRGVGASHQTGWTGLIGRLLQPRRGPKGEAKPSGKS
jgi:hypothetical protein